MAPVNVLHIQEIKVFSMKERWLPSFWLSFRRAGVWTISWINFDWTFNTLTGAMRCWTFRTFDFSLNVFTKFNKFSDKNICHYSKRAWTCHAAASCVRDQDATTVPARHVWETGSLNYAQFMLQWFIRFPEFSEFLFHLGKTPLSLLNHNQNVYKLFTWTFGRFFAVTEKFFGAHTVINDFQNFH